MRLQILSGLMVSGLLLGANSTLASISLGTETVPSNALEETMPSIHRDLKTDITSHSRPTKRRGVAQPQLQTDPELEHELDVQSQSSALSPEQRADLDNESLE